MIGILCFGDSLTFGEGDNVGWCGRLKEWFEKKSEDNGVYNLGIPGHTSAELLERFDTECNARLKFRKPLDRYSIIIAIGANDTKYEGKISESTQKNTKEGFEKNILGLIKKAKSRKQKLAFFGISPVNEEKANSRGRGSFFTNERIAQFNGIVKESCRKEKVHFLDLNKILTKKGYTSLLPDGLHPNSEGYGLMFREIQEFLEENNILP